MYKLTAVFGIFIAAAVAIGSVAAVSDYVTGSGISPVGLRVGDNATFQVHTEMADADINVEITDPNGKEEPVSFRYVDKSTFEFLYKLDEPGRYIINILCCRELIVGSPFAVDVASASSEVKVTPATFKVETRSLVHVVGPAVERPVEVFKPTYFTADFKGLEPGDVDVDVFDENNVEIPTKLTDNGDFTYRVDFEPFTVGSYHYEFFIDDQKVSDTNNEICVKLNMIDTRELADAANCYATGQGIQPTGCLLGEEETFQIHKTGGDPQVYVRVEVTAPDGTSQPMSLKFMDPFTFAMMYTPETPGVYQIHVCCGVSYEFNVEVGQKTIQKNVG